MAGDESGEGGLEQYRGELFQDLCGNVMELCVNVGLFNAVASNWPPQIQENWNQKIHGMIEWVQGEITEVQSFAEFFDDED
jgi:hypothetical protein